MRQNYLASMFRESVYISRLIELNEEEITELAKAIDMTLGDKHVLKRIIKAFKEENNGANTARIQRGSEIILNQNNLSLMTTTNNQNCFNTNLAGIRTATNARNFKFEDNMDMCFNKGTYVSSTLFNR